MSNPYQSFIQRIRGEVSDLGAELLAFANYLEALNASFQSGK
jgi:hypothetical protein